MNVEEALKWADAWNFAIKGGDAEALFVLSTEVKRLRAICARDEPAMFKAAQEDDETVAELRAEVRRLRDERRFRAACAAMQGLLAGLVALRREGFNDDEISEFAMIQAHKLLARLDAEKENTRPASPGGSRAE